MIQPGAVRWQRVSWGSAAAYVVARDPFAAIIDTGMTGSVGKIEEALSSLGLDWSSVGHVIITHAHPDHIGGLEGILEKATEAVVYASEEEIDRIESPRSIMPVNDGDMVFGLQIVGTPGHTPGHISVLESVEGVLFAGDAVRGAAAIGDADDGVVGPDPTSTEDMAAAVESVERLASIEINTILFGHGHRVERNAGEKLDRLVAEL
jgi:glyoxylase-like metal-dependent hydrolase (beta-lactamase superfamily II)